MRFDDFVAACSKIALEQRRPRTFHDYAWELGIKQFREYKSLRSALNRALKVGGKHHDLLGKVFVLQSESRGRQPANFGENPPSAKNEHPPIEFEGSPDMVDIESIIQGLSLPGNRMAVQQAQAVLSRVPPRHQQVLANVINALVVEKRFSDMEAAHATREAASARENEQFYKDIIRARLLSPPDGDVEEGDEAQPRH
jgi:hypothetical protein